MEHQHGGLRSDGREISQALAELISKAINPITPNHTLGGP